ncbi:MAG: uracil-DNA glycosylase [Candidatus Dependentiae bacterium]|nr:uracil-DNA glycosylase [Candidatus Dependentiae bacterium]
MTLSLKPEVAARLKQLFTHPNEHQNAPPGDRLKRLYEYYKSCRRCPLGTQGRSQVVFGEGCPTAPAIFIGEAPGREEDTLGRPFVGRSGRLLTGMMDGLGLTRDKIYIANTARCRPPENRQPLPQESSTCISLLLLREISAIKPRIICTLGATATNAFLDYSKSLSSIRGQIIQTEYFAIMPTYHPAYLLRNPPAKDTVIADFVRLIAFLDAK